MQHHRACANRHGGSDGGAAVNGLAIGRTKGCSQLRAPAVVSHGDNQGRIQLGESCAGQANAVAHFHDPQLGAGWVVIEHADDAHAPAGQDVQWIIMRPSGLENQQDKVYASLKDSPQLEKYQIAFSNDNYIVYERRTSP